jgi:hypothetical protein
MIRIANWSIAPWAFAGSDHYQLSVRSLAGTCATLPGGLRIGTDGARTVQIAIIQMARPDGLGCASSALYGLTMLQ